MKHRLACLTLALVLAPPVHAQPPEFPATLAGHALITANRMIVPPADAPPGFAVSGRFTGPGNVRTDGIGTLPQRTGIALPFVGQPLQGFSGIKPAGDGSYWVLTDNGFGTKRNSADALLMLHKVRPDFRAGTVAIERTIFLADPNRVVPFPIATDPSPTRYLTGADFDLESIQPVADGFWIGEEFGPLLIKLDTEGRVQRVVETRLDGQVLMPSANSGVDDPTVIGSVRAVWRF